MIFANQNTVKISAPTTGGSANTITFDGITSDNSLTPEAAASQINKILDIASKEVSPYGMKRISTQEAVENG